MNSNEPICTYHDVISSHTVILTACNNYENLLKLSIIGRSDHN